MGIALSPFASFTCPQTNGYPYPWVLHDTVHYATGFDAAPDYRGLWGSGLNPGCASQTLSYVVKMPPDAPSTVYVMVFAASTPMTIWGNNSCAYDVLSQATVSVTGSDTALRVNLMMQQTSGAEPSNLYMSAPSIANWGLWPVDASRFCVREWVSEPPTPALSPLTGSHYILALPNGTNWGPGIATPWTNSVSFMGVSQVCDATHVANWQLQTCFSAAPRYIPGNGGFLKPGNDGDYAGLWWSGGGNFTKTDDYSKYSTLSPGFAGRSNDFHYGLYDNGSLVCEMISWSAPDPSTGQAPCNQSNCPSPTPTFSATPSPTASPSPTSTPRIPLVKTVDRSVATIGDTLTYCLNWTNDSSNPVPLVIWDTLNPILTYLGGSPAPAQNGQVLTWNLGSVAPGSTGQACFWVRVDGYP